MTRREAGTLLASGSSLLLLPAAAAPPHVPRLGIGNATVEWREDPIGVDTLRPRFRWALDTSDTRPIRQAAFRIRVFGGVGSGVEDEVVADSGWVRSPALYWQPSMPLPLRSHARYRWELVTRADNGAETPSTVAGSFVTGILDPAHWNAAWIAAGPEQLSVGRALEWKRPMIPQGDRMPILRGHFDEDAPIRAAFVSVIGLGQYALAINGDDLNAGHLSPAWSDYGRTAYYDTYDVTGHLRPGRTIISATLGNGFLNVEGVEGRYTKFVGTFGRPRLLLQLRVILADGRERLFSSDASWSSAPGAITLSSLYSGEDHDARVDVAGWQRAAAPPAGFGPVTVLQKLPARLAASPLPPMTVMRTIEQPAITTLADGSLMADFGINFAGRPRIALDGLRAGATVGMKPAELLADDGHVDQASATGGGMPGYNGIAFNYTASGAASGEAWAPSFSYTGFRYLQLEGVRREQIKSLSGEMMHLASRQSGRFACSDERLVRIHRLIEQAFLSNFASVLTDCPHREKLGWLEQTYLNASTAFFNRDCAALYEKIARDMREAQLANGMVPTVAPEYVAFVRPDGSDTDFRDSPEWGCAIVLAPWAAYRFYGDDRILVDNFDAMERYATYLEGRAIGGIVDFGLGDWFDIGPSKPGKAQLTSKGFTGTATLFAVLHTMTRIAETLQRDEVAARYRSKAAAVAATVNRRYFDATQKRYDRGSQTAQAMALSLGIADPAHRTAVLAQLVSDIVSRDHHVSAGDVGFHYVVDALIKARRAETMYAMLKRTDPPSYGAQIERGATALTEAWDAAPHASQNHFMLGHAETWLFSGLGGIGMDFTRRDAPVRLAPQPVGGVEWSDVSLATHMGEVRCVWHQTADAISIEAAVPAGTTAELNLPAEYQQNRKGGGGLIPIDRRSRILGSGRHRFSIAVRTV